MKQHVESMYATDTQSLTVATVCGRNVKREYASRFRSAAGEGRRYGRTPCKHCQTRSE